MWENRDDCVLVKAVRQHRFIFVRAWKMTQMKKKGPAIEGAGKSIPRREKTCMVSVCSGGEELLPLVDNVNCLRRLNNRQPVFFGPSEDRHSMYDIVGDRENVTNVAVGFGGGGAPSVNQK